VGVEIGSGRKWHLIALDAKVDFQHEQGLVAESMECSVRTSPHDGSLDQTGQDVLRSSYRVLPP
jgi:hypothetical protein